MPHAELVVHPEYILFENLPGIEKTEDITPKFWENRFEQINNFENNRRFRKRNFG